MYDLYTIIENFVLFLCRDVVFKIVLPLVIVFLVLDIIRYMFSKNSKKEDIVEALKGKAFGLVCLIMLPFALLWFIGFIGKIAGVKVDMDTSIIQKLINSTSTSIEEGSPK